MTLQLTEKLAYSHTKKNFVFIYLVVLITIFLLNHGCEFFLLKEKKNVTKVWNKKKKSIIIRIKNMNYFLYITIIDLMAVDLCVSNVLVRAKLS